MIRGTFFSKKMRFFFIFFSSTDGAMFAVVKWCKISYYYIRCMPYSGKCVSLQLENTKEIGL